MTMKTATIRQAFSSDRKCDRIAAIKACANRDDVPVNLIEAALSDPDTRTTAVKVCDSLVITSPKVRRGMYSSHPEIVLATIRSVRARGELTLDFVAHCLKSKNSDERVKRAAAEACADLSIPPETVFEWRNGPDHFLQLAAAYSCAGHPEVADRFLGLMLDSRNEEVRKVALHIEGSIPHAPYRNPIAPPKKAYKKCLNDVIVVATIPDDAIVYGDAVGPCRTNKAEITSIKGSFYGEKVGISIYDLKTTYRVGDKVEFDPKVFNRSDRPYGGPGFYFFQDEELARIYNL